METHARKAEKTLRLLLTTPKNWSLVKVNWAEEKMKILTKVKCSACRGRGQAAFLPTGELVQEEAFIKYPEDFSVDGKVDFNQFARHQWMKKKEATSFFKKCPQCPSLGEARPQGSGKVWEQKIKKMYVGRPEWPAHTKFDSPFKNRPSMNSLPVNHGVCELCEKKIHGHQTLIPVIGKGENGIIHGLWIEEECLEKLGIVADNQNQVA